MSKEEIMKKGRAMNYPAYKNTAEMLLDLIQRVQTNNPGESYTRNGVRVNAEDYYLGYFGNLRKEAARKQESSLEDDYSDFELPSKIEKYTTWREDVSQSLRSSGLTERPEIRTNKIVVSEKWLSNIH